MTLTSPHEVFTFLVRSQCGCKWGIKPVKRMLMAALLVVGVSVSSLAVDASVRSDVDEGWLYSHPDTAGWQGVLLADKGEDHNESVSGLRGRPDDDSIDGFFICKTSTDKACTGLKTVEFNAALQPCSSTLVTDCIDSFGIEKDDGSRIAAAYVSSFPATGPNDFSADPVKGLIEGRPAGLWRLAADSGSAVDLHYLSARILGSSSNGGPFSVTSFSTALHPVEMVKYACTGQQCTPGWYPHHPTNGTSGFGYGQGREVGLDCVMTGVNPTSGAMECAKRKAFTKGVRYYLSVKLSRSPRGWFHGRLDSPGVSITPSAGQGLILDIKGKSVAVPVVNTGRLFKDLPANMQDAYRKTGGWPAPGSGSFTSRDGPTGNQTDPLVRNRLSIPPAGGETGLAELEAWVPLINDTASADLSQWSLRTLQPWEMENANKCFGSESRVNGVVITNATQYSVGPPTFNTKTQTLEYKVAAPHYTSGGALTSGMYHLIMRADVARCIYGLPNVPLTASVDVIEVAGETKTATTSVAETNGWLSFSAVGYTHSSPVIRTKIRPARRLVSSKARKSLTAASLARASSLKVSTGSRVSLSVSAKSRGVCRVAGSSLRTVRKGTCVVSVTVRTGSRSTRRNVTIRVT